MTPTDAFAPLRRPVFRALWLASVVSNVGTWMQNVGAGRLMTALSPSPTVVALVQATTTLPVFLLALPGGALADVLDRRRVLLVTSLGMVAVAAALGICTLLNLVNATGLLVFTFLLGAGSALFHDAAQPGRYVETFLVESWTEHLRQHERATVSDRAVQDRARAFHLGPEPPAVTHLLLARVV